MFGQTQIPSPESYDQIPYPSYPYPQTHPDHMAVLGILSGMSPAPVDRCRVLELGCASGGNLIPMANTLPDSEFVGIDFSGSATARAQTTISDLNLNNIQIIEQDFLSIDDSIGQFDYVIAHGIFSWVPTEVQEKIFAICQKHMAPNGIAYISYNIFPGWRMFQIVRDLMHFRIGRSPNDVHLVQDVRRWIEDLSDVLSESDGFFGRVLATAQRLLADTEDGYIRHDFLEEVNHPVYFADFIKKANNHGLQFLANGELSSPQKLPEEITKTFLADVKDEIEEEQYLDFFRNRTYRETLLCHEEQDVSRSIDISRLSKLRVTSRVEPSQDGLDITSTDEAIFAEPGGMQLSTSHPLTKAALTYLRSIWPLAVPYQALLAESWLRLSSTGDYQLDPYSGASENEVLATNLLRLYSESVDLVRFHTYHPGFVMELSEQPRVSAVTRFQAGNERFVTNLYHQRVQIDPFPRHLVQYMDGQHNYQDLLLVSFEALEKGLVEVSVDGEPVEDPTLVQESLVNLLSSQLLQIAQASLLVG